MRQVTRDRLDRQVRSVRWDRVVLKVFLVLEDSRVSLVQPAFQVLLVHQVCQDQLELLVSME